MLLRKDFHSTSLCPRVSQINRASAALAVPERIPDQLQCTLCGGLLTDAVMVPCCNRSYCDSCEAFVSSLSAAGTSAVRWPSLTICPRLWQVSETTCFMTRTSRAQAATRMMSRLTPSSRTRQSVRRSRFFARTLPRPCCNSPLQPPLLITVP